MHQLRTLRLEIALKPGLPDPHGNAVAQSIRSHMGMSVDAVRRHEIYTIVALLGDDELDAVRAEFTDPVIQVSASPRLDPATGFDEPFDWLIHVAFKPGVTDNVGRTAATAIGDIIDRRLDDNEAVYTSAGWFIRGAGLTRDDAERIGGELLANPLIETIEVASRDEWLAGKPAIRAPRVAEVDAAHDGPLARRIDLSGSDDDLLRISREGTLSLTLEEMRAIRDHFQREAGNARRVALGLDARPSDIELEMLAQTWSEHCKHKIFAARVHYADEHGQTRVIDSIFKTFVRATTEEVGRRIDWLVSVFHDNAGVIAFNDRLDLVYKAETHNSPSALEPYGGAMTGIVGCNRDPLGTGLGAELLVNVWGYCFADPATPADKIPAGVMHPRRLRDGVHRGVIDGGNQSGIPYGVGWEFFDFRYLAKPMVYCGTLGLLPKRVPDGRKAAEKSVEPGDLVVMAGGRIGKDGIHGATFSSVELHKDSPVQAVQIGDPITQKKMSDFLIEARDLGLFRAITDNGAGGLSSSIGEMAGSLMPGKGGCEIDLAKAPLKYAGLKPWEIWLSEAQERMSLAVPPEKWDALATLAKRRDVEVSALGVFTDSGYIHLKYGAETVGFIDIDFLHDGCPRLELRAEWRPPQLPAPTLPQGDLTHLLGRLLARPNLAGNESRARQYDHEVKGRTIVKPWIGLRRDVPSDATVFLAEYGGREGIVLARGFNSHYADLDCYAMVAAIIDEAVRRVLAVGGRLDYIAGLDNFCWPDPVESDATPDGRYKLAQLVRANQALYDVCTAFGVPLISGKDSMKNDSTRGGRKISVPPSLLFSVVGRIDDVARALTLEACQPGDLVYVIGPTRGELGGSELVHALAEKQVGAEAVVHVNSGMASPGQALPAIGGTVPSLRVDETLRTYRGIAAATRDGLIRSLHAPAIGGLAAGFARMAMAGELGMLIKLVALPIEGELSDAECLFSESCGRFIATIDAAKADDFEKTMAGVAIAAVGRVLEQPALTILGRGGNIVVNGDVLDYKRQWQSTLAEN